MEGSSATAGSGWPMIRLWSTTLFDEVVKLGFTGSYQAHRWYAA
jgi:hypothetical protein